MINISTKCVMMQLIRSFKHHTENMSAQEMHNAANFLVTKINLLLKSEMKSEHPWVEEIINKDHETNESAKEPDK